MGLPHITINGQTIQMPTDHGWNTPEPIGISGRGVEIVSLIWSYGMRWEYLSPDEYKILYSIWFNNINKPITANLPELGAIAYQLKTYPCYISPVSSQGFVEGFYTRVGLMLTNIDVS